MTELPSKERRERIAKIIEQAILDFPPSADHMVSFVGFDPSSPDELIRQAVLDAMSEIPRGSVVSLVIHEEARFLRQPTGDGLEFRLYAKLK